MDSLFLYLPTINSRPVSSVNGIFKNKSDSEIKLKWWKVEVIKIDLKASGRLFINIFCPENINNLDFDLEIGIGLLYWSQAFKFALKLLAKQKFIPKYNESILQTKTQSKWKIILNNTVDADIFNILNREMPIICRIMSLKKVIDEYQPIRSEILIESFLNHVIDNYSRMWLEDNFSGNEFEEKINEDLIIYWLSSLKSKDGVMELSTEIGNEFKNMLNQWTASIDETINQSVFRTCFCLEPPDEKFESSITRYLSINKGFWSLQFFIQAKDDPSLLIPANQVWSSNEDTISFLNKRFDYPQEQLLIDLIKASEIFSPIRESLYNACPIDCELTINDVSSFISEYSFLLQELGYGVMIPILQDGKLKKQGIKIQLSLKSNMNSMNISEGHGLLGLKSIVQFNWKVCIGDQPLDIEELKQLIALKMPIIRYRGKWVELNKKHLNNLYKMIQNKQNQGEITLNEALKMDIGFNKLIDEIPIEIKNKSGWIEDIFNKKIKKDSEKDFNTPKSFNGVLRPYQIIGFSWLSFMTKLGIGICLADDMGLGKTIQYIAFLLREKESGNLNGPSLLVCPTTILGNWCHEIERFAPSIKFFVYHGNRKERDENISNIDGNDLMITTYSILQRDLKQIKQINWTGIVLDEAQNIKNPGTKKSIAIKKLSANYRIAMTGTPIENHISELWSIFEFLNPGYLSSKKSFKRNFIIPIERYQDEKVIQKLNFMIQPFFLRRVKSDHDIIQDLPEKIENKTYCTLTKEQFSLYGSVISEMLEKIANSEGIQRKGLILSTITKLKQICNHPAQFLSDSDWHLNRSGKLEMISKLITKIISKNEHVLIFTQYVKMGKILQSYLEDTFNEDVLFLYGSTSQKKRDQSIKRFQEEMNGPHVFILSLRAGGLGINLTRAQHVIHFDRWWNPAVEDQATDRSYRIGQKNNVSVYKFITLGTIEEKIDKIIEKKKFLVDKLISKGETWITELSDKKLKEFFTIDTRFMNI